MSPGVRERERGGRESNCKVTMIGHTDTVRCLQVCVRERERERERERGETKLRMICYTDTVRCLYVRKKEEIERRGRERLSKVRHHVTHSVE